MIEEEEEVKKESTEAFSLRDIKKVSFSIKEIVSIGTILISIGIAINSFYQIESDIDEVKEDIRTLNESLDTIEDQLFKVELNLENMSKAQITTRLIKIEHEINALNKNRINSLNSR